MIVSKTHGNRCIVEQALRFRGLRTTWRKASQVKCHRLHHMTVSFTATKRGRKSFLVMRLDSMSLYVATCSNRGPAPLPSLGFGSAGLRHGSARLGRTSPLRRCASPLSPTQHRIARLSLLSFLLPSLYTIISQPSPLFHPSIQPWAGTIAQSPPQLRSQILFTSLPTSSHAFLSAATTPVSWRSYFPCRQNLQDQPSKFFRSSLLNNGSFNISFG